MKYYSTQVFMIKWETSSILQVCCRPDALAPLCAEILEMCGRSSPKINVCSVEHRGSDVASFLFKMEVPISFKKEILEIISRFQAMP
jgi:hypothetical protein